MNFCLPLWCQTPFSRQQQQRLYFLFLDQVSNLDSQRHIVKDNAKLHGC